MKWASIRTPDGVRPGVVDDGVIYVLDTNHQLIDLIADGAQSLSQAGEAARRRPQSTIVWESAEVVAPLEPRSIRDSLGFHQHMRNAGGTIEPRHSLYPQFYFSNVAAVGGPYGDIPIPPKCEQFDYELEIAAIIGRPGGNFAPDAASEHIIGYTIFNDWSARDVQMDEMALMLGTVKGKDTANTFGPLLVTADEFEDRRSGKAFDIAMSASVNGKQLSNGNWSSIDWSMEDTVSYAARGTALRTGDAIGTGTVSTGCLIELNHTVDPAPGYLNVGDIVEFEVELMGSTKHRIVDRLEHHPLSSGW